MPEIIDCSHCLYFHTYSYYDEDFNEYWLSECKFDNLSFDQYICSSFKATEITKKIFIKYQLSNRSYIKLIKMARTIADLECEDNINSSHVLEALSFRKAYDTYFKK